MGVRVGLADAQHNIAPIKTAAIATGWKLKIVPLYSQGGFCAIGFFNELNDWVGLINC